MSDDSILLRCPWVPLHLWSFESGTYEGLVPYGDISIIDDVPSRGKVIDIRVLKQTYGGGYATGSLNTAPYHSIAQAYKFEFWFWCDEAYNAYNRPIASLQIETGGIFRPLASDLVNHVFLCAWRSPGVWYRGVIMVWTTVSRIDYFAYNASGDLLCHSTGTHLYIYYGRPTAIRAYHTAGSPAPSETIHARFDDISVSYTPIIPSRDSRRRRAAWMDLEKPKTLF